MDLQSRCDLNEVGRTLGHDLFRFGRTLPDEDRLLPLREGYAEARSRQVAFSAPDRFVRKWLQLRLGAYRRERIFDPTITPQYLARIDVPECPITRVALTHGSCVDTDWSVDRLNNGGAYARSNLAVMSVLANGAKGSKSFDEVLRLSQGAANVDGLEPAEWLRLAAVMLGPSFAEHPALAPTIPLAAPIPRFTVRPGVQLVQHVFTRRCGSSAGRNAAIRQFRPACGSLSTLFGLERFADTLHRRLKTASPCWDAWLHDDVMSSFTSWMASIDRPRRALTHRIAAATVVAQPVDSRRVGAWHLAEGGHFH